MWQPEIGISGTIWATDYPRNHTVDGERVSITAIREHATDKRAPGRVSDYTTATISNRAMTHQYGMWEARIRFPEGKGHHPWFALFGANENTVGWPQCGEIDVMELQDTIQGSSLNGPGYDWKHGAAISTAAPFDVRGQWHTYWCRHEPNRITIGVDDRTIRTFIPADLNGKAWVFNQPMFPVLAIQLGTGANKPDGQPFPVTLEADWVRYTPLGDAVTEEQYDALVESIAKVAEDVREIRKQLSPEGDPSWKNKGRSPRDLTYDIAEKLGVK